MALLPKKRRLKMENDLIRNKEIIKVINNLQITDVYWDMDDPTVYGLSTEEVPEDKKKYLTNTIGKALDDSAYELLIAKEYKDKYVSSVDKVDHIKPVSVDPGNDAIHISDIPDHFYVLVDYEDMEQPFYWGDDYKSLLSNMESLPPFGDELGHRDPREDAWDREVDFERLIERVSEHIRENNIVLFSNEELQKILEEAQLYLPLEHTLYNSLSYLSDEQLNALLESQIQQLESTREGLDQAVFEVIEEEKEISEIDYWIKDLKVGLANRNQILSETSARLDKNKENKVEQEPDKNKAKKIRI